MKEKQKQIVENKKASATNNENIITSHDVVDIPDGQINGSLIDIQRRISEMYDYVDIYFEVTVDGKITTIKTGFPANISAKSTLGEFLKTCGYDIIADKDYDLSVIKEEMYGKPFKFTVIHETNTKGRFARIVNSTIQYLGK